MQAEKRVYVTESHHHVLHPWAELRCSLDKAPRLFTLDYHTDTRPAFVGFGTANENAARSWDDIAAERVAALNFRDKNSVADAIKDLRYDEHIDAAVRTGMVDIAFVAAYFDLGRIESEEQKALDAQRTNPVAPRQRAKPPFSYVVPSSRIVILPNADVPERDGSDAGERVYRDAALEAGFLQQRINLIDEITKSATVSRLFDVPFILDIDLDYFNTRRAIEPPDTSVVYELIRRAEIITIARESSCVEGCQLEGEGLRSEFLEEKLLAHIDRALAEAGQKTVLHRL